MFLNEKNATTTVEHYEQEIEELSDEDKEAQLEAARNYNKSLIAINSFSDPFAEQETETDSNDYESILDVNGSGMMGYIEIPKINVELSIYHGTSEPVLQRSAGHLEGSSFPVGGEDTHAVLTGHRGLPTKLLFTELDKLVEGDVFFIHVCGETLAYEVDQILTVFPHEMEALQIVRGEDYVTLVTCTPYAINTHRLLVRGTRVSYEEAIQKIEETEVITSFPLHIRLLVLAVIILLVSFLVIQGYRAVKRRRNSRR